MGKYLYQISDSGQIFCRFAENADQELGLRMDNFRELSEFTLEEKVNAAFIAASLAHETLDGELDRIEYSVNSLERDVDDLQDDVERLDRRIV